MGASSQQEVPALSSLNMRLRDDFVADAAGGVERWNRVAREAGVEFRFRLPHVAFHRHIGEFAGVHADPDGILLSSEEWQRRREEFLPSSDDGAFIASLMQPAHVAGTFASWIEAPRVGIDGKPGDFEYVKLHE